MGVRPIIWWLPAHKRQPWILLDCEAVERRANPSEWSSPSSYNFLATLSVLYLFRATTEMSEHGRTFVMIGKVTKCRGQHKEPGDDLWLFCVEDAICCQMVS